MADLNFKEKETIDEIITDIALSYVKRFYPSIVSKATGIPLNIVFDYLITLTDDERLGLSWEVKCPGYDCGNKVLRTSNIDDLYGRMILCDDCELEFNITADKVYPVFEVTDEYKKHVRYGKKKDKNLLMMM